MDRVVLDGSCLLINRLDGTADKVLLTSKDEYYTGAYEVTPGTEAVILATEQLKMNANVTVNPIPFNYGLIEWNGQYLKVS